MGRLFGTDGIRGIAGCELSCELAFKVGKALGVVIGSEKDRTVIVGMDTRISSDMLSAAVAAGICSVGGEVIDVGVCSTPAVAYLVKKENAAAGVMISASHNPYQYNGIKIFASDGRKLPDEVEERIESLIFGEPITEGARIGSIKRRHEMIDGYVDNLREAFGVRLDGMKIAVDCANGSASATAERLLSSLGAECYMLGNSPNGKNINKGCGSTSLAALKEAVVREGCDVGIAFDGDADRCIAADHLGREIDGDYIMAILALWLKGERRLAKDTLVGTVMTNMGLRRFCEGNEMNFVASAVGDRYVLEMMEKCGYSFGGEQSGHIIFGDIATTGDGQLTALALLSYIKKSGKSLNTLAGVMKKYPQYTINIESGCEGKRLVESSPEIKSVIHSAEEKLGKRGRILVRASGTEPLVRVMVECEDNCDAKKICETAAEKIKAIIA
ncbi:MAG: phosphoglucosamine mutase [Clostridia bacterium]|nr:phosphoglucosamine mutase [Clostridia bacterium]